MNELLFATTNEAKVNQIRGALLPSGIKVYGVKNKEDLPYLVEDGETAVENARKKALKFASHMGKTVFSMDNALYLEGLTPEQQPGLHVRRMPGYSEKPTDEQMIEYYTNLVSKLGEQVKGHWEFGMCIATPAGEFRETTIVSPRIFVGTVSSEREAGYPLESIQIDPNTGKYIAEMSQEEKDIFWQKAIGTPLLEFVKSVGF